MSELIIAAGARTADGRSAGTPRMGQTASGVVHGWMDSYLPVNRACNAASPHLSIIFRPLACRNLVIWMNRSGMGIADRLSDAYVGPHPEGSSQSAGVTHIA